MLRTAVRAGHHAHRAARPSRPTDARTSTPNGTRVLPTSTATTACPSPPRQGHRCPTTAAAPTKRPPPSSGGTGRPTHVTDAAAAARPRDCGATGGGRLRRLVRADAHAAPGGRPWARRGERRAADMVGGSTRGDDPRRGDGGGRIVQRHPARWRHRRDASAPPPRRPPRRPVHCSFKHWCTQTRVRQNFFPDCIVGKVGRILKI